MMNTGSLTVTKYLTGRETYLHQTVVIANDCNRQSFSRKREDIPRFPNKIHFISMYCHFGFCFNALLRKSITIVSQLRALQTLLRKRYASDYTVEAYAVMNDHAHLGDEWATRHTVCRCNTLYVY